MCKSKLLSVTDVSQIIKIIVLVDFFFISVLLLKILRIYHWKNERIDELVIDPMRTKLSIVNGIKEEDRKRFRNIRFAYNGDKRRVNRGDNGRRETKQKRGA